jgi:hypothetical protein
MLQGIAREKEVKEPTSKAFTQKYGLPASSAQRAIKALVDKEMAYEDEGVYRVYDQFMSHWMRLSAL